MSLGMSSTALSLVFGCLLLVLVAPLYYFLWWNKRKAKASLVIEKGPAKNAKGLFYWRCWTHCSMHCTNIPRSVTKDPETTIHETETTSDDAELELSADNISQPKSFGEESVELELMRLHNLAGPPRFLFTIIEENKEDLESEDGKSKGDSIRKGSKASSLSDVMSAIDTPFYTPVTSSSPSKGPLDSLDSYQHQGFNPLFELSEESELNRFRSSPPPKLKFLRDAEERFHWKLIEEARRKALENHSDGSFLRIIQNEDTERKQLQQYLPQIPSSSSQVLPLTSSPTTFKPLENASMVH
ncbi:uncharacterized protein LOC133297025 [Gastrolobium bilobum]|uniref:uncharacterized protein LOC133297025 n=1 Tax=Gastrolobium bilobum TaxID=150636 RepID=UPI002AB0B883|nr:uncharacterized protein LOC133297025 [Gastrolobium bilobum]